MKTISSIFTMLLCKATKKVSARVRKYIKEEKMKKGLATPKKICYNIR